MKILIYILVFLLVYAPAYSNTSTGQRSEQIEVSFDLNSCALDPEFQNNSSKLTQLQEIIDLEQRDSAITISAIEIDSYASPEGDRFSNDRLTKRRSDAIYDYLTETLSLSEDLISRKYSGVDWDKLHTLVEESDMEYRDDVLYILANVPEERWEKVNPTDFFPTLVDSRNKHLMDLKYGRPYHYMVANLFTKLRTGTILTIYFKNNATPIFIKKEAEPVTTDPKPIDKEPVVDSIPVQTTPTTTVSEVEPIATAAVVAAAAGASDRKPIKFALKTNLLYDLLLTPNIELEVPIGQRWSVAGEWICPWWVTKNNGYALQILSGQAEGRYWFGDRTDVPQLTGWFGGLYAGGGLYDLQWKNNGYQGEFYIAAGLAGGYAHTINKKGNLRMEYSLGVGYLSTDYSYYEGMQNNEYLVWQYDGRYRWIGPTKAEVSLVWFVDWKRGGKR